MAAWQAAGRITSRWCGPARVAANVPRSLVFDPPVALPPRSVVRYSALERRTFILNASFLLNAALLLALLAGYGYYRFQQIMWNSQAFSFAVYAGTLQCASDHDQGIQRFYRATVVTGAQGQSVFTGERDHGVEVWSWPLYPSLGEAASVSTNEFVNAYNRRMQNFIRDTATRPTE